MLLNNKLFFTLLAAALTTAFAFADSASAATKKKLTYEEAYARCKAILDKEGTWGTSISANLRYTRGAGCMKKYGYRI